MTQFGISLMFRGMSEKAVLEFIDRVIEVFEEEGDGGLVLSPLHHIAEPQEVSDDPER